MKLVLGGLFALSLFSLGLALVFVLAHRARVRALVGDVVVAHGTRTRRRALLFLYLGLALAGCLRAAEFGRAPFALLALIAVLGALVLVLMPIAQFGWIGARGVRQGWLVRPWEGVESWRLVGEHLRFLVLDRWHSIPVAENELAAVRAALTAVVPERESEYS